jgi:hypothetical protein
MPHADIARESETDDILPLSPHSKYGWGAGMFRRGKSLAQRRREANDSD